MFGNVYETIEPNPSTGEAGIAGEGPVTQTVYNADGEDVEDIAATGAITANGFDALGDQASTSLPNPSGGGAGGPTTTNEFDLDGEEVESLDPLDNSSTWAFDSFGDRITAPECPTARPRPTSPTPTIIRSARPIRREHDLLVAEFRRTNHRRDNHRARRDARKHDCRRSDDGDGIVHVPTPTGMSPRLSILTIA